MLEGLWTLMAFRWSFLRIFPKFESLIFLGISVHQTMVWLAQLWLHLSPGRRSIDCGALFFLPLSTASDMNLTWKKNNPSPWRNYLYCLQTSPIWPGYPGSRHFLPLRQRLSTASVMNLTWKEIIPRCIRVLSLLSFQPMRYGHIRFTERHEAILTISKLINSNDIIWLFIGEEEPKWTVSK